MILGRRCYCYNEECNQQEWDKQGFSGKRTYTLVSSILFDNQPIPICPYCKRKMQIVDNLNDC